VRFRLGDLGTYRIERSEEYVPGDPDNSYAGMIRVRRSKLVPPFFMVSSHLYKHSETELGLYLKERKNIWRSLAKVLGESVDIHEAELVLHFLISSFNEVARIVPFLRK